MKALLLVGAKVVIVGLCIYYIWGMVDLGALSDVRIYLGDPLLAIVLGLVFLLTPLNWYLEAWKWRLCLKPVCQMQAPEALNAVLRGLSLNWLLPFTIGDFIGRFLGLPKNRKTVVAMLLCRYVSLVITLAIGLSTAALMFDKPWILPLLATGLLLVVLASSKWLRDYATPLLSKIALVTTSRYLLFSLQFLMVAMVLVPEVDLLTWLLGIPIVFVVRSLIPSLLGAVGIREAAAIWVFAPYTDQLTLLTLASLLIWLMNIVVPSLYGLIPILNYKLKEAR